MKKIISILALLAIIFPLVTLAAGPSLWPTGFWGPLVSCQGNLTQADGTTPNTTACQSVCDIITTIINIIYFAMSVGIFIVAPVLITVGGVMVMISGANPEMLSKGKKTIQATLIGLVIIFASYLIVNTFIGPNVLNIAAKVGGFGDNTCTPST